jgi:murein L,D-transpeptidase YafK
MTKSFRVGFALLLASCAAEAATAARADRVLVEKSARRLTLYRADVPIATYRIALGGTPVGDKQRRGDGRTPEGRYVIDRRNAASRYHLSLHISYPDASDRADARRRGVDPGGDIFIHGLPNGFVAAMATSLRRDWTLGCIAVGNADIEALWRLVADGTPIEIRP